MTLLEHEFSCTVDDISGPDDTLPLYDKHLHITTYGNTCTLLMSISGHLHSLAYI